MERFGGFLCRNRSIDAFKAFSGESFLFAGQDMGTTALPREPSFSFDHQLLDDAIDMDAAEAGKSSDFGVREAAAVAQQGQDAQSDGFFLKRKIGIDRVFASECLRQVSAKGVVRPASSSPHERRSVNNKSLI